MDTTAYLITNVTVIDGTGGEPLRGGAVVVEDKRITWERQPGVQGCG
jgi:hypothetical protein